MPTVNASATTTAKAPKSVVWEILADYPNIANWTAQVKTSVSTSEATTGVGATRDCDLAPAGTTKERVVAWEPEDKIVIAIEEVTMMPIKGSLTTFSLKALDDTTTEITMAAEAEPKGGIFAGLVGGRLEKRLPKACASLIADLATEAESRIRAS